MQAVAVPTPRALWWSVLLRSAAAAALMAIGGQARAAEFSGTATLASDYVFRGVSQSRERPVAQFGVQLDGARGFYALAWASTVEYEDAPQVRTELDYGIGWAGSIGADWAVDLSLTRYDYPAARDWAYAELVGTLEWREAVWLTLGWSPDTFATGERAMYGQLGLRLPIDEAWQFEIALGEFRLDDVLGRSYTHAQAGVTWSASERLDWRLAAHHTDGDARELFPGLAGTRVEAALDVHF